MKKRGIRFLILRALARQLQRQADFLFRLVGEDERFVRPMLPVASHQEHTRQVVSEESDTLPIEIDIPPADWLMRGATDEPPAHWLARAQQVQATPAWPVARTEATQQHAFPGNSPQRSDSPQGLQSTMLDARNGAPEARDATFEGQAPAFTTNIRPTLLNPRAALVPAQQESAPAQRGLAQEMASRPTVALPGRSGENRRVAHEAGQAAIPRVTPDRTVQNRAYPTVGENERPMPSSPPDQANRPDPPRWALQEEAYGMETPISSPVEQTEEYVPGNGGRTPVFRSRPVVQTGKPSSGAEHGARAVLSSPARRTRKHLPLAKRIPVDPPAKGVQGRTPVVTWSDNTSAPGFPLFLQRMRGDALDGEQHGAGQRSGEEMGWPTLPDENAGNSSSWRAAYQSWEHQQRLDDEQRGKLWSV